MGRENIWILVNVLRLVLSCRIQSVSVNVPHVLGKKCVFGCPRVECSKNVN